MNRYFIQCKVTEVYHIRTHIDANTELEAHRDLDENSFDWDNTESLSHESILLEEREVLEILPLQISTIPVYALISDLKNMSDKYGNGNVLLTDEHGKELGIDSVGADTETGEIIITLIPYKKHATRST